MVNMHVSCVGNVFFDDGATAAMGVAFDQACRAFRRGARNGKVRKLIAERIIEAARDGERNPFRLRSQALMGFGIGDVSMPETRIGLAPQRPVYALIARTA